MTNMAKNKRCLSLVLLFVMFFTMIGEVLAQGGRFWQDKKISISSPTYNFKTNKKKLVFEGTTEEDQDVKVLQWIDGDFKEIATIQVKDGKFKSEVEIDTSKEGNINFKVEQEIAGKKEYETVSITYKESAPKVTDLSINLKEGNTYQIIGYINKDASFGHDDVKSFKINDENIACKALDTQGFKFEHELNLSEGDILEFYTSDSLGNNETLKMKFENGKLTEIKDSEDNSGDKEQVEYEKPIIEEPVSSTKTNKKKSKLKVRTNKDANLAIYLNGQKIKEEKTEDNLLEIDIILKEGFNNIQVAVIENGKEIIKSYQTYVNLDTSGPSIEKMNFDLDKERNIGILSGKILDKSELEKLTVNGENILFERLSFYDSYTYSFEKEFNLDNLDKKIDFKLVDEFKNETEGYFSIEENKYYITKQDKEEDKDYPQIDDEVKLPIPEITTKSQLLTNKDKLLIEGKVEKDCTVNIYSGFDLVDKVESSGGKFSKEINLKDGFNNIYVKALIDGKESAASNSFHIILDREGPSISCKHSETIHKDKVLLEIDFHDPNELSKIIINDEELKFKQGQLSYNYKKNYPVVLGENTVSIKAYDKLGNETIKEYKFKIKEKEKPELEDKEDEIIDIPCIVLKRVILAQLGKLPGLNFDHLGQPTDLYVTRKELESMDEIYYEEGNHYDLYDYNVFITTFEGLQHATNLKKLWLSYNINLEKGGGIKQLENHEKLESVKLRNNRITSIDPLKKNKNLRELECSLNKLSDISVIENFPKLEYLSLSYNLVEDIDALGNLEEMKQLELDGNSIKDISPLRKMEKMETLWMSNNEIEDISPLENMKDLKTLHMSTNKIKDISSLKNMNKLETLLMANNKDIKDISVLENLKNIRKLSLRGLDKIEDFKPLLKLENLEDVVLIETELEGLEEDLLKAIKLQKSLDENNELSKEEKVIYNSLDKKIKDLLDIEEPENPIEEPENPVEEPENPIEEPENPIEEPEDPIEEPENPIEEPEDPIEEPKDTGGIPVELDGKGEFTTDKPEKPQEKPEINFVDINNHWAESYIKELASKDLVKGMADDKFEPNSNVSRAELVTFLYRINKEFNLGLDKDREISYTDVKETAWYYDAVRWADSNNLVEGMEGNKFKAEDTLTREQLALVFARFLQELDIEVSTEKPSKEFKDFDDISSWAKDGVFISVNKGLLEGKANGKFAPKDKLTRGEMAAVLSRFINLNK